MDDVPGVRPDKADIRCTNCGAAYSVNHCNIPPNAKAPVRCSECDSGGAIMHNEYSHISGTYGAVEVSAPEGDA